MHAGQDRIELGLGLVSLGRMWGVRNVTPPSEAEGANLLQRALDLGIRVFDTAPAYGTSEERLGVFLRALPAERRQTLIIMTKAGEHWDAERGSSTDHTADGLRRSIDSSLQKLGRIDVLQIHKATKDVVASDGVRKAIEHAKAIGIRSFGASISDLEAARLALESGLYGALQFPLNASNEQFAPLLTQLTARAMVPIINRPFAMGGLVDGAESFNERARAAFEFIAARIHNGIVLTGTSKAAHLGDNAAAFADAIKSSADRHPLRA